MAAPLAPLPPAPRLVPAVADLALGRLTLPPGAGARRLPDGGRSGNFCRGGHVGRGHLPSARLRSAALASVAAVAAAARQRKGRQGQVEAAEEPGGDEEFQCPGCGQFIPMSKGLRHMQSCCPEILAEEMEAGADGGGGSSSSGGQGRRRSMPRPSSWGRVLDGVDPGADDISEEEMRESAERAVMAIKEPLLRTTLKLSFGMDRGWLPRDPQEVGDVLGGRYARSPRLVLRTIKQAQKKIPLVADDPSGLEVLYEDEDVLAVSKPPFLRTAPVHRFVGKSLVNKLVGYLRPANGSSPPFVVHRLDRQTTGVFICAKTPQAHEALMAQWHGPECSKEYLAIGLRAPDFEPERSGLQLETGASATVRAPLGPDPEEPESPRQCVLPEGQGRSAATHFKVLAATDAAVLLRCCLREHGRTHQVRVHAAHLGLPLHGDEYYGGLAAAEALPEELPPIARVALHAWRLIVPHPRTGEPLRLQAPPPADMRRCAAALGLRRPRAAG